MTSPPFATGVTPRRANLQAVGFLVVFYGVLYGNALLAGDTKSRLLNPVASSFILGTLMLLVVTLLVRRDPAPLVSLGLARIPLAQALPFGALGVVMAYGVNVVVVGLYAGFRGGMAQEVSEKAQWTAKLSDMPVVWILPLALFVGLWEEIVFRGFVLGRLRVAFHDIEGNPRARVGTVMAVVVSGVLFGAGHGYQGLLGLVQTSAVGIAFGALAVWRKSLWPAVIAHLAIDTIGLLAIKVLKPLLEDLANKGTLPH